MVLSKTEAVHLRVQDIDFEFKQITVRDGKGLSPISIALPTQQGSHFF
jgi:integrase